MSSESPNAILYDYLGNELAIQNSATIPANTPLLMIGGSDGTSSHYLLTDTSGREIVLADGYVTTSAPSYAANAPNYISLDTSGNLRVNVTTGTVTANQGGAPWSFNLIQIDGTAAATAAAGVLKVGIVGNAGATLDSTLAAGTAPTDGFGVLQQYNTTQPAPTNAQTVSLQSDQSGNLLEFPGVQFKTGAAWTSATAVNTLQYPTGTTTIGAPIGAEAIIVQLDQTTTLTGGAVTFQGSYDGINWVSIPTGQLINPQTFVSLTNPYTFVASTQQPFMIILQGFVYVRLNLTTVITGTGSVTPYWSVVPEISATPLDNAALTAGTAPANAISTLAQYNTTQPAPTNQQTVSLQSDQSGNLLTFYGVQTKTGAAWTSATSVNTLQYPTGTTTIGAPIGAQAVLVQLDQTTTLTGGAVTFQGTYDGINWVTIPTAQVLNPQTFAQLTNPYTFVASTQQPFMILLQGFQQIRANLTTVITDTGSVTPYWTVIGDSPVSTVAIASGFNTVQGMAATGAAVSGNPVYLGGKNPSGDVAPFITDADGSPIASIGANQYTVQSNATVTASGSTIISTNDFGTQQINLIVNIVNAPTGTTPTITYTIQEIDPGNQTTTMGNSATTKSITAAGVYTAELTYTSSNVIKVSWTVTGTTPSFTGVYATVVTKSTPAPSKIATYSAGIRSLSPTSANPTDLITIAGSATKTITVTRIIFTAIQTTAASQEIDIIIRTSANSGGTSTTQTAIPYDQNFQAASATVLAYTVNPTTLGTSAGNLWSIKMFVPAGGTTLAEDMIFDFTNSGVLPGIVLRGTAQLLAVNWGNGAALTTGLNINATIEWNEQ